MTVGQPPPALPRAALAAIFFSGSIGTAAELVLLEHTEGAWQKSPLVVIGIGCAVLAALAIRPTGVGVRIFQLTMAVFVASGVAGVVLHYQGNVEFELELQPDASGVSLFWEAMKGATPALAPGAMMLLGAIGLTYTYQHPAVTRLRGATATASARAKAPILNRASTGD